VHQKNESVEEVEITEATAYSEIEKVFKWAKKYMRASKGKNYPDVTVNTKFKDSIYVFLNLSIYNIMAISLGGKKGILVKHDTRKMEKGSDFKRKEHEFSSAKDVIKFAKKEYDSMPKDESVEESANLEEAIMLQHFGFVGSANFEEAYDSDEKHTMDPKSHVELNKETGMYCVYNIKGKKVAEFKTKEEAEEYAVKNHDSLMKESVDLEEALKPADFVKGGDAKVTKREVDGMLSKIFINTKLAKSVEASKAFKAGEKDAGKKKNPYKSDTADFHLYELGSQSASM
jgi:Ni,Fe-hydrogenase maturation factor